MTAWSSTWDQSAGWSRRWESCSHAPAHAQRSTLFTGTTRVAQEFKRRGATVWALDRARYSELLARCYVATDADAVDRRELDDALAHLNGLPGHDGYFTETFCRRSRYLQPFNGRRVDAIRDALREHFATSSLCS